MSENLIVNPNKTGTQSSVDEVRVAPSGASSSAFEHIPRRVPLFIPRKQAYYWTREWQEGIRKSMADLEAGNYTDYSPDEPGAIMRRFVGEVD